MVVRRSRLRRRSSHGRRAWGGTRSEMEGEDALSYMLQCRALPRIPSRTWPPMKSLDRPGRSEVVL